MTPSLSFVASQSQHQEVLSRERWQRITTQHHAIASAQVTCLYYGENFIHFALKSREIPLTSCEIASGPKCILWKGANLLTTEGGVSSSKQRTELLFKLMLGRQSFHQESVFNATTDIPEEGQSVSTNPQWPPRTSGIPHSLVHREERGT